MNKQKEIINNAPFWDQFLLLELISQIDSSDPF